MGDCEGTGMRTPRPVCDIRGAGCFTCPFGECWFDGGASPEETKLNQAGWEIEKYIPKEKPVDYTRIIRQLLDKYRGIK